MTNLQFRILDAQALRNAALPTIAFRLHVTNEGDAIEALVLRMQLRLEPQWRTYAVQEQAMLDDLFGAAERWEKTLHAIPWADVPVMVPQFEYETTVNANVACTYDFDLAATRYFCGLQDGEIPVRAFFSGSIFRHAAQTFSTERVNWSAEAAYRLPLQVWRNAMEACYGNSALIRIDRATLEHLHKIRVQTGAVDWDTVILGAVHSTALGSR